MKMSAKKHSTNIELVFKYWNKKNIIKHRVLTDRIRRKISGQLRDYNVGEICESIFNYNEVLLGDGYYWTFKWTIYDFLQRGLEKFMTDAEPYENFKCSYPVNKDKPKVNNSEYGSRFEQWKKASPEERKILEQKWGGK